MHRTPYLGCFHNMTRFGGPGEIARQIGERCIPPQAPPATDGAFFMSLLRPAHAKDAPMTNPDRSDAPQAARRPALEGLVLRASRPQDAEAIAEMVNLPGFRWGTSRLPYSSPEEVRGWMDKSTPGSLNLLAVIEGQLVGSASLNRYQGRRAHAGVIGIGVHDDFVGRGVGTALMTALVDTADRWLGLRRLELTVFVDNVPAIALYRRLGFELEGTHRGFGLRDGRYVDAHAMARLGGPE
jgi:putative acetyltransferase